ncbi:MAG TPA: M15 family metallopeptidase, partial [Tepidiformaceae bacterium]|nr:M15 family metallopeptidase [Tepidiformaceae bacterium]
RRVSAQKRNGTVGRESKGGGLPSLFIGSIIAVVIAFLVLVTVAVDAFSGDGGTPAVAPPATDTPTVAENTATTAPATSTTAPAPSPTPATTADDGSIVLPCGNILVPLDKQHKLTADCAPTDLVTVKGGTQLRAEAAGAFNEMLAAASKAGFTLYANSAYRSYAEQASTFQYWVNTTGLPYAERTSARAGHSEHQLGTTADVGARGLELEAFEGTPEAAWLAANSYKFGFIVSYPDGKESITGYAPEPWHVRYVGKDVAQKVHDSGLTLHEYLLR